MKVRGSLSHLASRSRGPWLCLGDFNEIVDLSEKCGGAIRSEAQMDRFRSTLSECNLGDLGYLGSKFTWSNKRENSEFNQERLDRAVATPSWCANFPNVSVETLPVLNSDHKPLLLHFDSEQRTSPSLFWYEAKWNIDEECVSVIQRVWSAGEATRDPLGGVVQDLSRSKTTLIEWSRAKFGGSFREIIHLSRKLNNMQRMEFHGNLASIRQIQGDLNKLLGMKDVKWWQGANRNWFKGWDRNTQFFHTWANREVDPTL